MTSRPRRSAAAKASETIAVQTRLADESERRERNPASRRSERASDAMPSESRRVLTVKVGSGGPSGTRGEQFEAGEIVHGTRNRGGRKNYVVASSPDDDDDEEEPELDDDDEEGSTGEEINMDVDAEGEEDEDAEGEEDAEGDIDMDGPKPRPTIKVSRPTKGPSASRKRNYVEDEEDDDLSDPGESDGEDQTMNLGGDEDAEGEEIEVAGEEDDEEEDEEEDDEEVGEEEDAEGEMDAEGEAEEDAEGQPDEDAEGEIDSDEDGSAQLDKSKMTKRQRARFEDQPHEFMKLSDEVQVKKHFTAEELSMRRQEMARRRRNLSEKRNEEVKMETINKLLKKQAPKLNRKAAAQAAAAANEEANPDFEKPNPIMVRYVTNKSGSKVAVPSEMLAGPTGKVFTKGGLGTGKMVEEVA